MIQIVPAIDLMDGRCTRLSQGDFSRRTTYAAAPVQMVAAFIGSGMKRIHIVDLDGARAGRPVNLGILKEISSERGADIEWGGGIKTEKDVEAALEAGAAHVICGTVAVKEPEKFAGWLDTFGADKIILGADVRGLDVAVSGWTEGSGADIFTLVRSFLPGISELIVTDISRDGMLQGPAVELYSRIMAEFPDLTLTASGGVGSMKDIEALERAGVPKVIVGKAIYERKISMEELESWSQKG